MLRVRRSRAAKLQQVLGFFKEVRLAPGYKTKSSIIKQFIHANIADEFLLRTVFKFVNRRLAMDREDLRKSILVRKMVREMVQRRSRECSAEELTMERLVEIEEEMRSATGNGMQDRQRELLEQLFNHRIQSEQLEWLEALLTSSLSIGASSKTFSKALQACIDEDQSLPASSKAFLSDLRSFSQDARNLTLFLPTKPQLAAPMNSVEELCAQVTKKGVEEVYIEPKLDGERLQIHYCRESGNLAIYSRSMMNTNKRFAFAKAKLVECFEAANIESIVLDCEIIGWDYATNLPEPFSFLQNLNEENCDPELLNEFRVFAFDLLLLNGKNMLMEAQCHRRAALEQYFSAPPSFLALIPSLRTDMFALGDVVTLQYNRALRSRHEGLIVKDIDGPYLPDSRRSWYKVKYLHKAVQDNVDLVVLGGFYGKGRREKMISSFLLGALSSPDEYTPITCVGSGFSNEVLETLNKTLRGYTVDESTLSAHKLIKADVQYVPNYVWEIAFDSFSLSSYYTAGAGIIHPKKGLSLRFPIFLRERYDKSVRQATTVMELLNMYNNSGIND